MTTTSFDFISANASQAIYQLYTGAVSAAYSDITSQSIALRNANPIYTNKTDLPIYAQAYSIIYNIPNLNVKNSSRLILTWEILADMYLGHIIYWNDSRLVELNPALWCVDKKIVIVCHLSNNSIIYSMTMAFTLISQEWKDKYGPVLAWPEDLNITRIDTENNVFSTFAKVFSVNYTISQGAYTFFNTIGSVSTTDYLLANGSIDYAGFKKPDGNIIYPDKIPDIKGDLQRTQWHLFQPFRGLNISASWPFIIMGYIILPQITDNINCTEFEDTLQFLRWCYIDGHAHAVAEAGGFYLPSSSQIDEIVNYLDSVTCKGRRVLEVKTQSVINQPAKIAVSFLFWLIVLATVVLLGFMKFKKTVSKVYAIILVFGLVLCGTSTVLWVLPPTTRFICYGRWWLMGLGMVLFSGGVFCRSYQLKKIHHLVKSGRYHATKNLDHIKLLVCLMGILTLIEFVFLVVLQHTVPFKSEKPLIDPIKLIDEYQCNSADKSYVWVALQSVYLLCILLMGIFIIYSTWRLSSHVDDTRINILMFFICLVTLIVADVIWGYSEEGENSDAWWALSLIMVWGLSMMCSVFVPKLFKVAKESRSSSQDITGPTGTSTSM